MRTNFQSFTDLTKMMSQLYCDSFLSDEKTIDSSRTSLKLIKKLIFRAIYLTYSLYPKQKFLKLGFLYKALISFEYI
jgi:hypothetical protein